MIDAHRGAFEYDWRTRFHKSLRSVGRSMSWGEAYRAVERLMLDPSSHVAVSVMGWDFPVSRDQLAVMDLYDLHHQIAWAQGGKKGSAPKPHPGRPFKLERSNTNRYGNTEGRSRAEVVAYLNSLGHHLPVED